MPKAAADRSATPTTGERLCAQCRRPLPVGSRAVRRFCSSRCRVRAWDLANRPDDDPADDRIARLFATTNRKHYHGTKGGRLLVGRRDNEPWLGTTGCPPECPGLLPGETFEPLEPFWRKVRQ